MALIVELLNKAGRQLTLGKLIFLILALLSIFVLKARSAGEHKIPFSQIIACVQCGLRRLRSASERGCNERTSRSRPDSHGGAEYVRVAKTSLVESSVAFGFASNQQDEIVTAGGGKAMNGGVTERNILLRISAPAIVDGRRSRNDGTTNSRSNLGIGDDLECDQAICCEEVGRAREMQRLHASTRLRPRDFHSSKPKTLSRPNVK